MARPMQHREWIREVNLRKAVTPIAVAILLILIASPATHAQTFTTLHGFSGMPDGAMPIGGLTMSASGDLYGTTEYGGAEGSGMVFKLVHTGGTWIMHPLYSFPSIYHQGANDGAAPTAGVTIGPDGNLYGTNHWRQRQLQLWHGVQTVTSGVGVQKHSLSLEGNHSLSLHRRQ